MAVRLRHCCCGCSLKEGTIVTGVIFVVSRKRRKYRTTPKMQKSLCHNAHICQYLK
jgi:hypothetical protein